MTAARASADLRDQVKNTAAAPGLCTRPPRTTSDVNTSADGRLFGADQTAAGKEDDRLPLRGWPQNSTELISVGEVGAELSVSPGR